MYITRITLENIRGFRKLDFRLEHDPGKYEGWTVFTGFNGCGKTALLKAIALALNGPVFVRALEPSLQGWVRKGATAGAISLQLIRGPDDVYKGAGKTAERLKAAIEIVGTDKEPILRPKKSKQTGPTRGPWYESPQGWFSCGYGPFRRLYGESSDAQRVMSGPGPVARFATMFREDASLIECERWLRDLNYRSLEAGGQRNQILEDVKTLLNDDFMQNGMKIDRIDSDGIVLRDNSGLSLPLKDMSDGYRAAVALLIDIVRHMISVYNPETLFNRSSNSRSTVDYPGVVLIDEVDSHLHPEWQRQIGFWLKSKFPKVQFLVTTHSPFICQAADSHGIFHLPMAGEQAAPFQLSDENYQQIITAKSDAILLTPAFGMRHTRSPEIVRNEQEYSALKAKEAAGAASEVDRKRLKDLNKILHPLLDGLGVE